MGESIFSRTRRVFVLAVAGILLFGLSGLPAQAAPQGTVIVTKAADTNDGTCDADCSLREAIGAANAGDSINFAGDYAIVLKKGQLEVNKNLIIDATGHNVSVSGNDKSRVFYLVSANVTLTHLTITHGYAKEDNGGGIYVSNATLTLNDSTVSFNRATYDGGGIRNEGGGTLIVNSTFSKNSAGTFGGAVAVVGGSVEVKGSTFTGDRASTGGAMSVGTGSNYLAVSNSTLYNETATYGTIYVQESLYLYNTTIYRSKDVAPDPVGLWVETGSRTTVVNTVVAGSYTKDCKTKAGAAIDDAFSNLTQDKSCFKGHASNLRGEPKLGKLKNNGGTTKTLALLSTSKAIDAGHDTTCIERIVNGIDQRGEIRPQGTHCDIGAYEYVP